MNHFISFLYHIRIVAAIERRERKESKPRGNAREDRGVNLKGSLDMSNEDHESFCPI